MLTVPPWVRPHQYWWRRTHELCPPLPAALGCGQGQGGGWLRKRTSLRGGPSIGQALPSEADVRSVSDVRFISVSTNALEIPMNLFGLIPFHGNSSINTMLYFM
jgi:hypothetical protein